MECSDENRAGRPWYLHRLVSARAVPARPSVTRRSRRFTAGAIAGLLCLGCFAAAFIWTARGHRELSGRATGQYVAEFAIRDVRTGQLHRLSDHSGRIVAIVWIGTTCPISELYFPRLNSLARKFENRGVDFLAINSNESESADQVAEHARLSGIQIPVLKDALNRVADLMLAERTCEALVVDGRGVLRYRGAIDDQYVEGSRREQPQQNYLAQALEAVIAGEPVSPDMTPVTGCPIERTQAATQLRTISGRSKS
jgi:AhpC/TSA family